MENAISSPTKAVQCPTARGLQDGTLSPVRFMVTQIVREYPQISLHRDDIHAVV